MSQHEKSSDQKTPAEKQEQGSEKQFSSAELDAAVQSAVSKTVEQFEPLIKHAVEEQGERTRQGQRDAIEARVGDAVKVAVKELGLPQPKASGETDTSSDEGSRQTTKQDEPKSKGSDLVEQEMGAILEEFELKGDEPGFAEWVEENKGKPWYSIGQSFHTLAKDVAGREKGTSVGNTGETKPAASDGLVRKYVDEMNAARQEMLEGKVRASTLRQTHREIKDRYRKQGVDVDQIGFGATGSIARTDGEYKPNAF